jgi:hypothetical protein
MAQGSSGDGCGGTWPGARAAQVRSRTSSLPQVSIPGAWGDLDDPHFWLEAVSRLPALHVAMCRAPSAPVASPSAAGAAGASRRVSDAHHGRGGHGHGGGAPAVPSSVRLYRCVTCFGEEDGEGDALEEGKAPGEDKEEGPRLEVDPRLACAFCTTVLHAGHTAVYVKEVRGPGPVCVSPPQPTLKPHPPHTHWL